MHACCGFGKLGACSPSTRLKCLVKFKRARMLCTDKVQPKKDLLKLESDRVSLSATRLLWTNTPKIWSGRSIVNTFMARYQEGSQPRRRDVRRENALAMDDDSRQ